MLTSIKAGIRWAFAAILLLSISGCYTQLGGRGMRSDVYDEEYYAEGRQSSEEPYWDVDEGRRPEREETVVYHHYDHDVYVHGYAPVYLNAWWYDPYWYYSSDWWWREWRYYDPWTGFYVYYGDPFAYYGYRVYGSWGFFRPHYVYYAGPIVYPVYVGGGGSVVVSERRDFGRRTVVQNPPVRRTVMTAAGPAYVTPRTRSSSESGRERSRTVIGSGSATRSRSTATPADVGRRQTVSERTRTTVGNREAVGVRSRTTTQTQERSAVRTDDRPARARRDPAVTPQSERSGSTTPPATVRQRTVTNRTRETKGSDSGREATRSRVAPAPSRESSAPRAPSINRSGGSSSSRPSYTPSSGRSSSSGSSGSSGSGSSRSSGSSNGNSGSSGRSRR